MKKIIEKIKAKLNIRSVVRPLQITNNDKEFIDYLEKINNDIINSLIVSKDYL